MCSTLFANSWHGADISNRNLFFVQLKINPRKLLMSSRKSEANEAWQIDIRGTQKILMTHLKTWRKEWFCSPVLLMAAMRNDLKIFQQFNSYFENFVKENFSALQFPFLLKIIFELIIHPLCGISTISLNKL